MTHAKRIEMQREAQKLAEMLDDYQRIYMQGDDALRKRKEREFDDRRDDFQIQYNTDFVQVLEGVRSR